MKIYSRVSIIVQSVFMNMEFGKTIYELVNNVFFNTSDAKYYVEDIEREIRMVK